MKPSVPFRGMRDRVRRESGLILRHARFFMRHATLRKIRNLLRVQREMSAGKTVVTGYPYEIILDVTNRCNLRCPLCVTGQRLNERPFGEMRVQDFKRVIDELAPYLFKVRFHSWGEPLLHPHLSEMLVHVREKNVGSEISTNLTVFRPEQASELIDSGLELLIVSLDGTTEDVYRTYRVGGSYQRVLENVRLLVQEKERRGVRYPLIEIQFLLMRHNLHQRDEIRKLADRLGVDRCRTFPVVVNTRDEEQRAKWLPADLRFTRYLPETFEDRFFSANKVCPWLWRSAVINWDGSVSPCCVYEGPKTDLGKDVFLTGFMAVWNNPSYRLARSTFGKKRSKQEQQQGFNICQACQGLPRAFRDKQKGIY